MSTPASDPDDAHRFGPEFLGALRHAAEEANWLLSRDYPADKAMGLIAEHRRLAPRLRRGRVTWVFGAVAPSRDPIAALFAGTQRVKPETRVEFVQDAAHALARVELVATSDPALLDQCRGWINLVALAVRAHIAHAWVV